MSSMLRLFSIAPLLFAAMACGDGGGEDPAGNAGSSNQPGPPGGTGGTGGTGYVTMVPLAGSGQALGGGDQGLQFGTGDVVMIMPPEMGGMPSGGSGGGSGIPGDGHVMTATLRRGMSGTAIFTQTGEDVTVVFDLTGCSDGQHTITINDGYACDAALTEGKVWGARGSGIGPDGAITCSGGKGTLTYTRTGADKTKNWTVADHVQETDVTAHVLILSDGADVRAGCANFF